MYDTSGRNIMHLQAATSSGVGAGITTIYLQFGYNLEMQN